ncbi:NUDIX hydrolase [Sessilibacter corallicola]|uniref:NUDIX hydrolase n=1 Tax=Sessilibacter corallicola TaxID=2904075 RepID=A0ABQ0A7R1_9GAMM|nr:NUDIX hydrolase [Sessilibacter corallicola]MCE2028856.1 NUDIX hydrolase [Sessilibacter corallicola]
MKFCSICGSAVTLKIPHGDDRQRYVCDECNTIHYQNPKIITGCLPVYENKVLLCKRAIEPRSGLWTLPAGFMENGESMEQGAARESWEEARLTLKNHTLYQVFSLPHISQVYVFYLSEIASLDFGPGPESLEVELFTEAEIPWDKLAFPVVRSTLKDYFADFPNKEFPIRNSTVTTND